MRSLPLFIALALFSTVALASTRGEYKPIVYLSSKNFHDMVENNDNVLIEFYGEYCPHSQKFASSYESLAQRVSKSLPNVQVTGVDVYANFELAEKLGVRETPSIMLFTKKGSVGVKYPQDTKDINDIYKWVANEVEKSHPAVLLQETAKIEKSALRTSRKRHGRHHRFHLSH